MAPRSVPPWSVSPSPAGRRPGWRHRRRTPGACRMHPRSSLPRPTWWVSRSRRPPHTRPRPARWRRRAEEGDRESRRTDDGRTDRAPARSLEVASPTEGSTRGRLGPSRPPCCGPMPGVQSGHLNRPDWTGEAGARPALTRNRKSWHGPRRAGIPVQKAGSTNRRGLRTEPGSKMASHGLAHS